MAKLFAHQEELLIHLTADDIFKIRVTQVEGGGVNYYGCYDVIHGNYIPITKDLAMKVIDKIKEGKICDIQHDFMKDKKLNF